MKPWTDLFRKPARLTDRTMLAWFGRIADQLLNRTLWLIAGAAHRLIEIEFYYRHPKHLDPFAHGDPVQIHTGRWYFHKTGGAFRGGTFKGVDLTFGDGEAQGGILIRTIAMPDGSIVDGPSLVVDHLLRLSGKTTVAELDQAIVDRLAWDPSSPLHFIESPNLAKPILSCARVGLSLRRARSGSTMPSYLTRPYRCLTEPAGIAKGKVQLVLALHKAGRVVDEIRRATGCPSRAILGYIAEYEDGLQQGQFEDYFGKELSPKDLCRLHGIADRV